MQLKFRAWDSENKRFIYPHLSMNTKNFFCGFNETGIEVSKYGGKGSWIIYPLLQFTNFYSGGIEKPENEIYDLDILEFYEENIKIQGVVIFDKEMGAWMFKFNNKQGGYYATEYLRNVYKESKIIGSMQENPDLNPRPDLFK